MMETRKYKFGEIEKTKLERKIQKGTRVKMEEITNDKFWKRSHRSSWCAEQEIALKLSPLAWKRPVAEDYEKSCLNHALLACSFL